MTQVATSRVDGAYTVIELLVVIAIVLVLAALVVTVLSGKPVEVKRTEVIIRTVTTALAMAGAQGGSTISPTNIRSLVRRPRPAVSDLRSCAVIPPGPAPWLPAGPR